MNEKDDFDAMMAFEELRILYELRKETINSMNYHDDEEEKDRRFKKSRRLYKSITEVLFSIWNRTYPDTPLKYKD